MKRIVKTSFVLASAFACSAALAAASANRGTLHTVTTSPSPVLGYSTAFDGSDTLGYHHSYDMNVYLLQQHSKAERAAMKKGKMFGNRPLVQLSGVVGVDGTYSANTYKSSESTTDWTLGTAKFDIGLNVSKYVTGLMVVGQDKENQKAPNSWAVQQAFVTLGNLNVHPVFLTGGKMYVPFGRFANMMVSSPLTDTLFQTNASTVDLGYNKHGLTLEGYAFQGSYLNSKGTTKTQGGVNANYTRALHDSRDAAASLTLGAGYITNIMDSDNLVATFNAAGTSTAASVPGVDLHGHLRYHHVDVVGEYMTATKGIAKKLLANKDGDAAKLGALSAEATYNFNVHNVPVYVGGAYGATMNASQLKVNSAPVAESQYSALVNVVPFKNTALQLQYSHLKYNKKSPGVTKSTANQILTEFDVYF